MSHTVIGVEAGTGAVTGSVAASLDELARFGGDADGGVTRSPGRPSSSRPTPGSPSGCASSASTSRSTRRATCSGAGRPAAARAVLVGSHLDTVPSGGRFDGALGVVAAVHAVAPAAGRRASSRRGRSGSSPSWTRRGRASTPRSSAAARSPARTSPALGDRVDADGDDPARRDGHAPGTTSTGPGDANRIGEVGAYLELHIEQGPVLEAAGCRDRGRHLDRRPARLPRAAAPARRTTPARRRWRSGATRSPAPRGSRSSCATTARAREAVTANVGKDRRRARRRERRPRPRRLHDRRPRDHAGGAGGARARSSRRRWRASRPRRRSRSSSSRPSRSSRSSSTRRSSTSSSAPPTAEGASSMRHAERRRPRRDGRRPPRARRR